MAHRFRHHYTPDQARALLPKIRVWLVRLHARRNRVVKLQQKLNGGLTQGRDLGGPDVHGWIKALCQCNRLAAEFNKREIQIKDLERGLVDFPAILGGKEVFLCWEKAEEDIEFWHDLDAGYAGRERL